MSRLTRTAACGALALAIGIAALAIATAHALRPFPSGLDVARDGVVKPIVLARDGTRLSVTRQNAWNATDSVALHEVPEFLQHAFVQSEDQRFYAHHGVDWLARASAAWQNLLHAEAFRGASTITEQVVRMVHPRRRTLWSRWVEGFEAQELESKVSKRELLTFYLNQVPYADQRRGVVQAARYYFNRDLATLSRAEMLSLVVMVRSPYGMDLRRNPARATNIVNRLADRLVATGDLTAEDRDLIRDLPLALADTRLGLDASHFVTHVIDQSAANGSTPVGSLGTTLDAHLQASMQEILDTSLKTLAKRKVRDAGMLVIDHSRNEILAWVVSRGEQGIGYDTVLTRRQPGSTMKPLLYAIALEGGWTAATMIDDSALSESVGTGQHTFRNYSRVHYGPVRLREALGNSLNIPAVKALKAVGTERFLDRLHGLGVSSLQQHPDFYGDGLALGNGEVSLYEMAQAYTTLARRGQFRPLASTSVESASHADRAVFTEEVASLIANILADPDARSLEFGRGLQFPVETAIKTGTSTDYRDAWAIGFDYAHTVAVWMGNLDNTAMDGVTGSVGPAMVLRSAFAVLNRNQETRGLWLSPRLVSAQVCRKSGAPADGQCESVNEWFVPGTAPLATLPAKAAVEYRIAEPTPGLQLARDPRIPDELEAFTMSLAPVPGLREIAWHVDGAVAARTPTNKLTWRLVPGRHEVRAEVWTEGASEPRETQLVRFYVR